MSDTITHLTNSTFSEVVASADRPVVVDFWATWCKPCLAIAPILEEIAAEYGDKVLVAKIDVDENADTARQFDVRSIPTLIVFEDGQPTNRITGAPSKAQLLGELKLTSPQSGPGYPVADKSTDQPSTFASRAVLFVDDHAVDPLKIIKIGEFHHNFSVLRRQFHRNAGIQAFR